MKLRVLTAAALVAAVLAVPPAARADFACTDSTEDAIGLPQVLPGMTGRYALPEDVVGRGPKTLVAFAHGYGHISTSWVQHMQRTAARGAIAFATDYRGTVEIDGQIRGWRVTEGAEEAIAVAQAFLQDCPSLEQVILYGVSMGGNTSGLAVAAKAQKPGGAEPLFDYWVAGEPVANTIEEYLLASAVAPFNATGARAQADMEAEFGGTLAERPAAFQNGTVLLRAQDIAASGVKGVAVLHGFDDGLVPFNQSRELVTALRALGLKTDMYNFLRRNPSGDPDHEGGTTLSENVGDPLFGPTGQPYPEPLTGHGTESSQTHTLIQTGLDIVFELMAGNSEPANHEFVVDEGDRTQVL